MRTLKSALRDVERDSICKALRECNDNRKKAAKLLDISLRNLYYRMDRLGLHDPYVRKMYDKDMMLPQQIHYGA